MTHELAVTPERLCTADFMELLDTVYENNNLNRLVVDEVGHIFNTLITKVDPKCHRPIAYRLVSSRHFFCICF